MSTWRIGLVAMSILAILLSGCGINDKVQEVKGVAETVVEQAQKVATKAADEPKAAATDTLAPTIEQKAAAPTAKPEKVEAKPTEEPEDQGPPELKSLEGVESYRQTMTNSIEVDGELESEWTMMSEYDPDTPALRFIMSSAGQDGEDFDTETIQIGDLMYTRFDDQWMVMQTSDQDIAEQMSPWAESQQWMDEDCQRKGKENIAGENTVHYQCDIDINALTQAMAGDDVEFLDDIVADFWISEKYDVAVKSAIVWNGKDQEGRKVIVRFETLIEDIGKPVKIEKPEGVDDPGVGGDLPIYEGANQMMAMPNMTTYEVEADIADVSQFYQDALAKAGWTYQADQSMAPTIMSFAKEGQSLSVMINQDGTKVSVMLMTE